jgi:hypothetical protein
MILENSEPFTHFQPTKDRITLMMKSTTTFNPDKKETLTYGECLGPAMKITDEADARQYFEGYVAFIEKAFKKEPRQDEKTAADVARINLGYYAGYYDSETRERVERLFKCAHPVFGSIKTNGAPTSRKPLTQGNEWAGKLILSLPLNEKQ